MSFRNIPKEMLQVKVPNDLATQIRETAGRQRRTLSSLATELLCLGLKIDPREFGLEPVSRRRKNEPEPAEATA